MKPLIGKPCTSWKKYENVICGAISIPSYELIELHSTYLIIYSNAFLADANSPLLIQLSGKTKPNTIKRNVHNYIAFVLDEQNKVLGIGASVLDSKILMHKKYVEGTQSRMVRFHVDNHLVETHLIGTYGFVALMKVRNFK